MSFFCNFLSYQATPEFVQCTIGMFVSFLIAYIISNDINFIFSISISYIDICSIFFVQDDNLWYRLIVCLASRYQARPKFDHFTIDLLVICQVEYIISNANNLVFGISMMCSEIFNLFSESYDSFWYYHRYD